MTDPSLHRSAMKVVQGLQDSILETLMIRFGAVPECFVAPIRGIRDESRLRVLHQVSLRVASIDEFEREL